MQWVKRHCCLPSVWLSLHGAILTYVSEMHIFQNGTPCQSETCFRMAHVSKRHATRAHHGLFKASAFETLATFHKVAKSHWTVQWFIQAKSKDQSLAFVDKHWCHPIYRAAMHTLCSGAGRYFNVSFLRKVFIPNGFYSERFLFRNVLFPKGFLFRRVFTPKIRNKNLSE